MHPSAVCYLALAALALSCSALLTLQAYEFRRFARSRSRQRSVRPPAGTVLVICPCRGAELNLEENLHSLFRQDHGDYQLVFVVDDPLDAAGKPIRRLMAANRQVAARIIVAGPAGQSGQKVHNLLAATAELPVGVRYLAFVDSDAQTRTDWLRQLVQRLDAPGVVAATAYRWLIPARANLANSLVHALDAAVAALVGPSRHHLVWGGSWAVRRDVFEEVRLRDHWQGTLSDDLVASSVLGRRGKVEFEPGALVASGIDFDRRGMFEFVRRQLTIGRFYVPAFWSISTVAACLQQFVFWIGLGLAPSAWRTGGWPILALAAACGIYALQAARGWLREDAGRRLLPETAARTAAARRAAIWGGPLVGLLQCWGLLAALASRQIAWRGIRYELLAGGQVRFVRRPGPIPAPETLRQAA